MSQIKRLNVVNIEMEIMGIYEKKSETASLFSEVARTCFCFLLLAFGSDSVAIEEPKYQLITSEKPFEIRLYEDYIIAETSLEGSFDSASRGGFRRVASYIFGGNKNLEGRSEKIQMTAPVTVSPVGENWLLHFVMPRNYSVTDLPEPNDSRILIKKIPEHLAGIISFSGWTTQRTIDEKTSKLLKWLDSLGYQSAGPQQISRYNDPFTLPWLRRNEIIFEIKKKSDE
ncbi:MAG: hypothetical protein CBC42_01215 [Betaproteobacteria bacterium TMED82]|nr:MAG: hypothetical protein CBC42_01215 [Betaproteobacteria bacterium TMED82]|tara:strand:- start:52423 stop:53106 length:684 start_codon:yes stop_codon:yes gene_type:complete